MTALIATLARLETAEVLTDAEFYKMWDVRIEIAARRRNEDEVERLMLAQGDAICERFAA